MASVQNIGINGERNKAENERISPATGMSKEISPSPLSKAHTKESYWFAHSGTGDVSHGTPQPDSKAGGDLKEQQAQKDREEKIRVFRELQEEERLKKMRDMEQQFLQAKKHREQQEEERRRRIEEARIKELERRQQVEERKRQIWEAEQERKEAILRRNMEREARIEARRNAQRNSQCFAFGSSTPRMFDLDLAAIGTGRSVNGGSVLMSSVSRRSEERELGPPRATSACSLDRKFENVSNDDHLPNDPPDNFRSSSLEPMPSRVSYLCKQIAMQHKNSDDMRVCLSMWDNNVHCRPNFFDSPSSGWLVGSGVLVGDDCMSRSMVSLSSSTFRGRKKTDIMPTLTRERSITPHITPRGKDTSCSPSRPQSSMSGTSDISAASSSVSAVNMRARPGPRRPRPYSVAGSIVDSSSISAHTIKKEPERRPRLHERNVSAPPQKPQRAKSASRENTEIKNSRPLTAPKKPVPPPKPSDVMTRAKSHPVPTKDNLRKVEKSATKPVTSDSKASTDASESPIENPKPTEKVKPEKKEETPQVQDDLPSPDFKPNSPITSPTTDSEMMISSDDSKVSAVGGSDMGTLSQSVTESDHKVEESSVVTPPESQSALLVDTSSVEETVQKDSVAQDIPEEAQLKEVKSEIPPQMQNSFSDNLPKEMIPSKPRITSEEEARAALAEKRRLAREQAEREAELERQRLEEEKRKEEEQRRLEELEQKRMEEEQIRLAELHRQLEQEKLAKAIEEQQQREKEEQQKRDEEARQKAEKEEQERKAREEAEKQRIELQEKLRKEEEERAERKKRVEQIMTRTRGKAAAQSPSNPPSENGFKSVQNVESPTINSSSSVEVSKVNTITNGVKDLAIEKSSSHNGTSENHVSNSSNSWPFSEAKQVSNNNPLPDILNSENIANHTAKSNGPFVATDEQSSKISVSNSFTLLSNRTLSANQDTSPQTNGYSSHEEMSCTTSPEENAEVGLLIDIQSNQQRCSKVSSESIDFTKLVDVDPTSLDNVNNENYLINVDDVNSNLFNSGNPFMGFEDSLQKKQDTQVTDLLS